ETGAAELVADLGCVLAEVRQAGSYRAIVLASESPEFLPGTEGDIAEEIALDFQRLIIESEIPVVAALAGNVRGHAWLISQFCDPGGSGQPGVSPPPPIAHGAGLAQTTAAIFMYRFGADAGREILLTGAEYSGDDLRRRVGALIVAEGDQALST